MTRIVATLTYNKFPDIIRKMPVAAEQIVGETVTEIKDYAVAVVPVATGALRDSIEDEVDGSEGAVYTAQAYSHFVEYGTVKMPAQPYMTPASEAGRTSFMRKFKSLEDRLE